MRLAVCSLAVVSCVLCLGAPESANVAPLPRNLAETVDTSARKHLALGDSIDGKPLYDRVYFHGGERTVDIQEGTQWSTYKCLAGCINKGNGTNVYKIPVSQGAQAVLDHCCTGLHFKSLCKMHNPTLHAQGKEAMEVVHKVEVDPFAPRGPANRKQNARVRRKRRKDGAPPETVRQVRQVQNSSSDVPDMSDMHQRIEMIRTRMGVSQSSAEALANQAGKVSPLSR